MFFVECYFGLVVGVVEKFVCVGWLGVVVGCVCCWNCFEVLDEVVVDCVEGVDCVGSGG